MTEKQAKQIEDKLVKKFAETEVGTKEHEQAFKELLLFQKQLYETLKIENDYSERKHDREERQIEKEKDREERQIDRKEKKKEKEEDRNFDLMKFEKRFGFESTQRELDRKHREKESKRSTLISLFSAVMYTVGVIGGTYVGYKCFDKQTTKAFTFEENGTITSTTSKNILGSMKPPKM